MEEIRNRTIDGGIRPHEIRHHLQEVFYDTYEPASDGEKLQACIDEIERIKAEDLPLMTVIDKSVAYNREWRDAIENYNLIDMTEAAVRAALMREESRETFYRTDFPEQDDENWRANITCTLVDGAMVTEKMEQVMA